jgi:hypothetical protein
MKKEILKISLFFVFIILFVVILIIQSCHNDICTGQCDQLSKAEMKFICYDGGESIIFKNDATSVLDTLITYEKGTISVDCSAPCNKPNGRMIEGFRLSHLGYMEIHIESHGQTPFILFNGCAPDYEFYLYNLDNPSQTITVNSTTYDDVFSVQQDSVVIDSSGDKQKVPWKIDYSKSKGFVRFHMVNNQTWSKQ